MPQHTPAKKRAKKRAAKVLKKTFGAAVTAAERKAFKRSVHGVKRKKK